MAYVQVQETDAGVLGHVVIARDFVYVDWSKVDAGLQGAFQFLSSIRVEGAQLWATGQVALANGPITAKPSIPVPVAGFPTIQGAIANIEALDTSGQPTADWNGSAASIAFTILARGNVTIPKAQLIAAVTAANPAAGAILGIALMFAPSTLTLNIGHTNVGVGVGRDGTGRITHIGSAARP